LLRLASVAGMAGAASGVEEAMLCRRVVILLCFCDGVLFRTKRFVPDYRYSHKLLGNRNADEVVIIDVTPTERRQANRPLFYDALQRYAAECFSPITVGGGIRTLEEVRFLIGECSADKVVIGAEHLFEDHLAFRIADKFGNQALVAALDYRDSDQAEKRLVPDNAGEVLLNSIDRDGSLMGYDLEQLRRAASTARVPIMVAGGCGGWRHMADAFEEGADAACTSVIHHLTETSLAACKTWLAANCKQPVRTAA
jgi:cyclase